MRRQRAGSQSSVCTPPPHWTGLVRNSVEPSLPRHVRLSSSSLQSVSPVRVSSPSLQSVSPHAQSPPSPHTGEAGCSSAPQVTRVAVGNDRRDEQTNGRMHPFPPCSIYTPWRCMRRRRRQRRPAAAVQHDQQRSATFDWATVVAAGPWDLREQDDRGTMSSRCFPCLLVADPAPVQRRTAAVELGGLGGQTNYDDRGWENNTAWAQRLWGGGGGGRRRDGSRSSCVCVGRRVSCVNVAW